MGWKVKITLLKDILKENGGDKPPKYSQGRVYLFLSVVAYYVTLGVLLDKALECDSKMELESYKTIIDALQYAMLLFASYAFGTKGVNVVNTFLAFRDGGKSKKTEEKSEPGLLNEEDQI